MAFDFMLIYAMDRYRIFLCFTSEYVCPKMSEGYRWVKMTYNSCFGIIKDIELGIKRKIEHIIIHKEKTIEIL